VDQVGHQVKLGNAARRIISLVPSQTELLYDLGLDNQVVGITKFCVKPASWFQTKTRIGGTKTLNLEKIEALKPDLIFANKEENTKSEIDFLQEKYPVYTSNISSLLDAFQMIEATGKLTNSSEKSDELIQKIKSEFSNLNNIQNQKTA